MFTGYVLQRFPNRVQLLEGIGTCGGSFAVTKKHKVVHETEDRDDAEAVASIMSEE